MKFTMSKRLITLIVLVNFLLSSFLGTIVIGQSYGYSLSRSNGVSMCPHYGTKGVGLWKTIDSTLNLTEGKIYVYQAFIHGKKKHIFHRYIGKSRVISDLGIDGNQILFFKGDNQKTNGVAEEVPEDAVLRELKWHIVLEKCEPEDYQTEIVFQSEDE